MILSSAEPSDLPKSASFSPFPVELQRLVFCHLPSFHDVLSLASTCHELQDVWLKNVATIYKAVAKASIACEHHARALLADQGGPAPDAEIPSARNVYQMMKNQSMINKAILQFESQIVSKVKTLGYRVADYYGAGALKRPPYLIRTERPRFIRSYYHFWGLLAIDNLEQQQSRLQSMSLKQLLYLCEISWLPDGMGPGEGIDPESESAIYQTREAFSKLILEYTESTYRRIHGQDMELIWVIAMDEGYSDFLVMWDHWQSSLKEVVCGRRTKEPPYKKEFHWDLWEDSPNEEI